MNNKKLTGVLVDVDSNTVEEATINDELEDLRKIVGCSIIDIVTRTIDGKPYRIVCDDNALLQSPVPRGSLFNGDMKVEICGNCFICSIDETGELKSLSEEEIKHVLSHRCSGTLVTKDTSVPAKIIEFIEID